MKNRMKTMIAAVSVCFALLTAYAFAVPGSCSPPISCPGGSWPDNGTSCTCNGHGGLIATSDIVGQATGYYCSKNVNCTGPGQCDIKEQITMYVRWIECRSISTEDICHIKTCEDGIISRSDYATCGCLQTP